MSHTNSTTNYGLPQFLTTDKPFWLTDINGAFANIDVAIKNAKTAGDNAQTDASQALLDASAASSAAAAADGKGSGAVASLADAYSAASTYNVGDIVTYNNLLYKNIVAITTPEAWDGTHWTRVTVEDVTNALAGNISTINTTIGNISTSLGGFKLEIGNLDNNDSANIDYAYSAVVFVSRGGGGIYQGHWSGFNTLVSAPNHTASFTNIAGDNPYRLTITNSSGVTDRYIAIYW